MKKELKKIINGVLGGMIGTLLVFTINVAAETLISSGAVSYSNSKTSETAVDGALDELFSAVDINQKIGSTDISAIGDGTINGAINTLNTGLSGKQATITGGASTIVSSNLTANRALVSDGSGKVGVSAVTSTELGYLDGVTSNVQTQLNSKTSLINAPNAFIASCSGGEEKSDLYFSSDGRLVVRIMIESSVYKYVAFHTDGLYVSGLKVLSW